MTGVAKGHGRAISATGADVEKSCFEQPPRPAKGRRFSDPVNRCLVSTQMQCGLPRREDGLDTVLCG